MVIFLCVCGGGAEMMLGSLGVPAAMVDLRLRTANSTIAAVGLCGVSAFAFIVFRSDFDKLNLRTKQQLRCPYNP